MFIAEFTLMIIGSREALQTYIKKISHGNYISETRLYRHFKLVPIHNLWTFTYSHFSYEWDVESEWAWSEMYDEAKAMGLLINEKLLVEQIECFEE